MKTRILLLENEMSLLKEDRNQIKRLRIIAEIVTPILKDIRNMMINRNVPDYYYVRSMITACLLRSQGKTITWEVMDFNNDNQETLFNVNILNEVESVIREQSTVLRYRF
jgi:hypothetical protein